MRIALVSLHTSPLSRPGSGDAGGLNIVVRHQAEVLAALGHDVHILTRRQDASAPAVAEVSDRLWLHQLDAGPPRPEPKSRQHHHIPAFAAALRRTGAGSPPFDVLHSHHWMSGVAALPVARAWGVPHVQSYHSVAAPEGGVLAEGEPPETPDRPPAERRLARDSDRVVAISRAEARSVVALGAPADRVVVVPPGVDHDTFWPLPPDEVPDPGYVLTAARLQPLKGVDLAIRALARMAPAGRPRLVVAGEVSDDFAGYAAELHRLVDDRGLAGQVEFTGSQTRAGLAALLRSARACLVPSHSETFGLIALEAAACGTPTVAGAAGGLTEAVADGRSGRLVPDRDSRTWAAALTDLFADRHRYAALRVGAAEWAADFTWRASAEKLLTVYHDATSGRA